MSTENPQTPNYLTKIHKFIHDNFSKIVSKIAVVSITALLALSIWVFLGMKETLDDHVKNTQANRVEDRENINEKYNSTSIKIAQLITEGKLDTKLNNFAENKIKPISYRLDKYSDRLENQDSNFHKLSSSISDQIDKSKKELLLVIGENHKSLEKSQKELEKELEKELKALSLNITQLEKNDIRVESKLGHLANNFDLSNAVVFSIHPVASLQESIIKPDQKARLEKLKISLLMKVTGLNGKGEQTLTQMYGFEDKSTLIQKSIKAIGEYYTSKGFEVISFSTMERRALKVGLTGNIPSYVQKKYSFIIKGDVKIKHSHMFDSIFRSKMQTISEYKPNASREGFVLALSTYDINVDALEPTEWKGTSFDTWFSLLLVLDDDKALFGFAPLAELPSDF